ncbi:MAG: response regulator SirA [Desulfitibacter sp. BRH_c19]|nr:MAG: response regulator SirA [Desulfitibacter sp. BRH_c19]
MAEIRIDCLYEACPIPLLKAMKKLKKIAVGDVLIIETDHSCAIKNFTEWTQKNNLPCEIVEVDNGEWEIRLIKR